MVFSSDIFLFLFFPLLFLFYYNPIWKGRKFRNIVLTIGSLAFYAWGEPIFVFVMLFCIFISWWLGKKLEKTEKDEKEEKEEKQRRKRILCLGIGFFVALLFICKYLSFCIQELSLLAQKEWLLLLQDMLSSFSLPIGVSFFTFQCMSYLFDIYYERATAQKKLLHVALYITLFPQMIAGPIVRYEQIAEEIEHRQESKYGIVNGMQRFIFGLGKKVLLANFIAVIADNLFVGDQSLSVLSAWTGALAYSLQIYFDFSGYSDMAIGLGELFGFHFEENFHYPYAAGSVTEFWHRWHISLSRWFRDYVYIPLGGNRVKRSLWIRNLFVVWLLTGIWHGANWTFLLWGLFYFLCLLIEKLTGYSEKWKQLSDLRNPKILLFRIGVHSYTLLAVMSAWVMFRAPTVTDGFRYLGWMFGIGTNGFTDPMFFYYVKNGGMILLVGLLFAFPLCPMIKRKFAGKKIGAWTETIGTCLSVGIFILSLLVVVSSQYNPFIYFNF